MDRLRQLVVRAPPVANSEVEDGREYQHGEEHRHADQVEQQMVHVGSEVRRRFREKRYLHILACPACLSALPPPARIAAQSDHDCHSAHYQKSRGGNPQQVHGDRAVLTGRRIVVETEQENFIDRRADLIVRRLHQSQADIARRILDAVEILRHPALRGEDHDGAGVGVLVGLRVVLVMEADGVGNRAHVGLLAGEKVPAIGGAGPAIAAQIVRLLRRRYFRRILGIEADRDHLEVLARIERNHFQRALHAAQRSACTASGSGNRPAPEAPACRDGKTWIAGHRGRLRRARPVESGTCASNL